MKVITATAAAFVLMAGMAFAQQSAMASKSEMRTGSANVEQNLTELEHRWVKASLASDGDALVPILSEDFVNINSDGTVSNKAESISRTKKAKWQSSEISEVKVNTHGDSAVVTGIWAGKGVDHTGKAVNARERWADTWVNKDGKWQCVASASAPLK